MSGGGADIFITNQGAEAFNHLPRVALTRTLAEVHAAFGAYLEFPIGEDGQPHFELIDMALATVIANLLPGDPLWLFLVGPPSAGKTEVISALADVPSVYALSSLTPQTFASGFERKGVETSLLPRLDGKTITMKDFGTVLTMYREKKAEILAQLREIYDGQFTKDWGNGKSLRWRGRVGLLAGVTSIIDREYAFNQVLGERFLLYRIKSADARKIARRALAQRPVDSDRRRETLRELVATFVAGIPLEPAPRFRAPRRRGRPRRVHRPGSFPRLLRPPGRSGVHPLGRIPGPPGQAVRHPGSGLDRGSRGTGPEPGDLPHLVSGGPGHLAGHPAPHDRGPD
jgi:hypothetical protein